MTSTVTLSQIREQKRRAEIEIRAAVQTALDKFTAATDVNIRSVELRIVPSHALPGTCVATVKAELDLGL